MARPPAPAPTRRPAASRPRTPAGPLGRGGRRRWRWLPSWKAVLGTLLLLALGVVGLGAFAYASIGIPAPDEAALAATTTVYYADGRTVLGQLASDTHRQPLTTTQMPDVVKQAAVASEDRSFYTNKGVSFSGLARAVKGVLTGSDLGGGSTITQQYVKNFTENGAAHTYTRKAREAVIALKVDRKYSKDRILTDYLNTIYFGRGANGVATAAKAYFGLDDPSQLSLPQAALLVGIIPSPSAWDPRKDAADAQKRYSYVLQGMVAMHYIDQARADQVATMPPTVEQQPSQAYAGTKGYLLKAAEDEVVRLKLRVTGPEGTRVLDSADAVRTAGLSITSTFDPGLQQKAEDTMNDPKAYPTKNRPASVQAGLVSIDPGTGGVVAMYGGADYLAHQRNAITQDTAQAGSTFKPFTLIAALQDGTSLYDTYDGRDAQVFPGYPKGVHNFSNESFGRINLIKATEESVNTVFIRLNQQVTPEATAAVAKGLGVALDPSDEHNLSNVLGTATVSPLHMAQAYAAIADGGTLHPAHFVTSVAQGSDRAYQVDTAGQRVIDAGVDANAVYAMQSVIRSGTGSAAGKALGKRPAAGKTGTVSGNYAAWFNGFTPQLETAVVLYNPSPDPAHPAQLPLGSWGGYKEITGGTVPTSIWTSYMSKALKNLPVAAFPKSSEASPTATATATATVTATATPTATATATGSPTGSPTDGATGDPTQTTSPSSTRTRTSTPTGTSTDGATDGTSGGGGGGTGSGGGGGTGGPTGFGPPLGGGVGAGGVGVGTGSDG